MKMRNFITCFFDFIVMLIFLQYHLVASLSPIQQKNALFQFKQSLTISTTPICDYEIPKTMNWSISSDYCTWEGVSCQHKTGDVIGLDLSCGQLEGAILPNSTLFQLSHLHFLNLSNNDFSLSNQFPQEFGFFATGLTHLNLSYTRLSGRVPSGISHLYKLVSLDLSVNSLILEDEVFKSLLQNLTQLRVLNLQYLNIFSVLPVNLSTSLRVLHLRFTGLHGVIPQEVFHLPNLEELVLGNSVGEETGLQAVLPKVKWGSSGSLQRLFLSQIDIYGGIPDSIGFLDSLTTLELPYCNLSGPIPKSIGNLGQLTYLGLYQNNFNGPITTLFANLTNLRYLDLGTNGLTGHLPPWLFKYPSLEVVYLSDNGFTGQLYEFDSTKSKLKYFYCRNNSLHGQIPQSFFQLVNLTDLDFSSNNFSGVLDVKMFLGLQYLDLSYNQIEGEIPHSIGSVGWNSLYYLNISRNRLTGGLEQLPWKSIRYLDLQSNKFNGSLPTLICNSSSLEVLNLSHNNFSGVLPICRTKLTSLSVFDLRMNNIEGNLPSALSNFRNLVSLNLHGNRLEGRIPSSFAEFDSLKVLDLGNNKINDTFPQCLEGLPYLQVLVLKSNKFHGLINKTSKIEHPFPSLRIVDVSYNEFSGPLPAKYFRNFKAMMDGEVNKVERSYMQDDVYYSDSTGLVIKGIEIELKRILTVFTTIDLSRNNFEGEIPEYIGNLVSLRLLNLSHNHLTGPIPSSIGKLSMLESLDLSSNQLEGEIPQELTGIYTLECLNLSRNQLSGRIPQGSQFSTFDNDSYGGNLGLCGNPLSKECEHDIVMQTQDEDGDDDYCFGGFTWEAVVIGYGCGVVPAFIIGNLMLLAGKPKWFAGIIARELGLKIRRMEIKWR